MVRRLIRQTHQYMLSFQVMFTYISNKWRAWQYKGWTYIGLFVLIALFIGLIIAAKSQEKQVVEEQKKAFPEVHVLTQYEISHQATIDTTTSFTSQSAAPLIARLGGRVTAVYAPLGTRVSAGQVVAAIDGGSEANPAQVQTENAAISLGLFAEIENQTRASLNNAVAIAKDSFLSAKAGKVTSAQIQQKNQLLAESAVDGAQLNREKSISANDEILIKSANLAVSASKITQDQAQLARTAALRQSADAVVLSQKGLAAAEIARSQTLASLASQKAGLTAQLRSAQEQVKLMQITSPLSGAVSRLTVSVGDYITPGTQVGEVAVEGNAKATIFIPEAVKKSLHVGQEIPLTINNQEKKGRVQAIATAPSAVSSLWQVDIVTSEKSAPNSTVVVSLPIWQESAGSTFVPLDALNVREGNIVVCTVDAEGIVHEHVFLPIHYYSQIVEGTVDLPKGAHVIVSGNRSLKEGDHVRVTTK